MGMRYYASSTRGIGGRLKAAPADFRVVERPGVDPEPLDASPGDYPYLVVEATATGRDGHAVLDELATAMDIHPGRLAVAGTKDANAITTQWVTIRKGDPAALPSIEDVSLKPIGRLGRQLDFGDHASNAFEIVVRGAKPHDQIGAITAELEVTPGTVRVPNFFGHQRFGSRRAITHVVGRHLLHGDAQSAVETYLTASSPHEPPRTRSARADIADALDEGDIDAALSATPGYLNYERQLLNTLSEHDDDAHRAALDCLPWSLTRLFVHAVQSHAFNEFVSERIRRGLSLSEPYPGDSIGFVDDAGRIDPDRTQVVTESRLQAARRHCERNRAAVVAPLVGPDTPPFEGTIGQVYRSVLDGLGLTREDFESVPGIDASGTWRPISVTTSIEVDSEPLMFSFELPPGCYATVVLREYLKVDPRRMA